MNSCYESSRLLSYYFLVTAAFCLSDLPQASLYGAEPSLPLPHMVVGKTTLAPRIDGLLSPGEWDRAAACSGFITAYGSDISRSQSVAWITYDDTNLYVAFQNNRGPTDGLLSKRGRRPDDSEIVHDHSNEIWFSPPSLPAETYQTLFNAYPGVFDVKMIPSVGSQAMSWSANWQFASSETADHWIIEAKAPIRSFGRERIVDGDHWQALFTTDVLGTGGGFRAWAPGGAFAEIPRHGHLEFRDQSAVVQLLDVESLRTGKFRVPLALTGPSEGDARLQVKLRVAAGLAPSDKDLVVSKEVVLATNERQTVELSGDVSGMQLTKVEGSPVALCELTVTNQFGKVLYSQTMPVHMDGYVRRPPEKPKSSPYDTPLGLTTMYAPLHKQLIVKVDRLYLPKRSEAASGTAKLIDPVSGQTIAERPIAPFYYDLSEFPIDLSQLEVPLETTARWKANLPLATANGKLVEENKRRKEQGLEPLPLKKLPFEPAKYELLVSVKNSDDDALAETRVQVELKGYEFEWMNNKIGISDEVIAPWSPITVSDQKLKLWNKEYELDGMGLARSVQNAGRPQLSGAMELIATIDGQEHVLTTASKVKEQHPAWVSMTGEAQQSGITFTNESRVEFDGAVLNKLRIAPMSGQQPKLDRLTLRITMPKDEAPCFVTTAGGWSATHGWTPQKWSSLETAAGTLRYNFVPYVLLTDSDRGFSWFADSVRGWILDEKKPTLELETKGDLVELSVHFVTRSSLLKEPTELTYGWNVTPQKPQPQGWRATHIDFKKPYPQANMVFYGMDQTNWDNLWAYYSSPYPKNYEKSRQGFDYFRSQGIALCAGNIAHAIARYKDYQGRTFYEFAADWGETPGKLDNGNVARSQGPNDFQLWHWDRWMRLSGLNGLYFDENYLSVDYNYLSGGAFLLPDEQVQPGYSYLGLRELNKRIRYLLHQQGLDGHRLWLHTTSGQPTYAWMPDVAMEAENVEPAGGENDYLETLPASRLRSIGMGRNLGAAPMIMCQADRHWKDDSSPFLVHQFVGWVLAHDCLADTNRIWPALAAEMEIWDERIEFRPYWKAGQGVKSITKASVCSAHVRPGNVILWIVNQQRDNEEVITLLDMKRLGLDPADETRPIRAYDVEKGNELTLEESDQPDMTQLALGIIPRSWRAVRLLQPEKLKGAQSFRASFDEGLAAADEALGYRFAKPLSGSGDATPAATATGRTGRALDLDIPGGYTFATRQHLQAKSGSVSFTLHADFAQARGTLFRCGELALELVAGKLVLTDGLTTDGSPAVLAHSNGPLPAEDAWQQVTLHWGPGSTGQNVLEVHMNNELQLSTTVPTGMPIQEQRAGAVSADEDRSLWQGTITLGPVTGTQLDDLVLERE